MRITLHSPFDWRVPGRRAVVAFKPGTHTMTRAQGDEAISKGLGKETKERRRGPAN